MEEIDWKQFLKECEESMKAHDNNFILSMDEVTYKRYLEGLESNHYTAQKGSLLDRIWNDKNNDRK